LAKRSVISRHLGYSLRGQQNIEHLFITQSHKVAKIY
jgi:hypothetical protein